MAIKQKSGTHTSEDTVLSTLKMEHEPQAQECRWSGKGRKLRRGTKRSSHCHFHQGTTKLTSGAQDTLLIHPQPSVPAYIGSLYNHHLTPIKTASSWSLLSYIWLLLSSQVMPIWPLTPSCCHHFTLQQPHAASSLLAELQDGIKLDSRLITHHVPCFKRCRGSQLTRQGQDFRVSPQQLPPSSPTAHHAESLQLSRLVLLSTPHYNTPLMYRLLFPLELSISTQWENACIEHEQHIDWLFYIGYSDWRKYTDSLHSENITIYPPWWF